MLRLESQRPNKWNQKPRIYSQKTPPQMFKSRLFQYCLRDPGQVNLPNNSFFRRGNACPTYLKAALMLSSSGEAAPRCHSPSCRSLTPPRSSPSRKELETLRYLLRVARERMLTSPPCPGDSGDALPDIRRRRSAEPPSTRASSVPPSVFPRLAQRRRPPTRRTPHLPPGGAWTPARGGCSASPPRACSCARVGARPRSASPPESRLPISPGPAGAGWSRGCGFLPGSLSALDSTVAMAEAPVRVRALASCREV